MLLKWLNLTFNHKRPTNQPTDRAAQITFLLSNTKINKSIAKFHHLSLFFLLLFYTLVAVTRHWFFTESTDATDCFSWCEGGIRGPGGFDNTDFILPTGLHRVPVWARQTLKKTQKPLDRKNKNKKTRDRSRETHRTNLLNMQFSFPKHL